MSFDKLIISIEVEQLRDDVRLAQRRVNAHVTISAARGEVLILQFAEGHN